MLLTIEPNIGTVLVLGMSTGLFGLFVYLFRGLK